MLPDHYSSVTSFMELLHLQHNKEVKQRVVNDLQVRYFRFFYYLRVEGGPLPVGASFPSPPLVLGYFQALLRRSPIGTQTRPRLGHSCNVSALGKIVVLLCPLHR